MNRTNFNPPRVLLLVEIERYCNADDCRWLNRIGLTESEARDYNGFTCERCESWNDDKLKDKDIPSEWRVNSQNKIETENNLV